MKFELEKLPSEIKQTIKSVKSLDSSHIYLMELSDELTDEHLSMISKQLHDLFMRYNLSVILAKKGFVKTIYKLNKEKEVN